MYKIYKIVTGLTTTGLLSVMAFSASAATVKFKIDYFDYDDDLVGRGSFSYDDEKTTCVEISVSGDCRRTPSDEFYFFDNIFVKNALTEFTANIYTYTSYGAYDKWWLDEKTEQSIGQVTGSRYGIFEDQNFWYFGDFIGDEQFYMSFEEEEVYSDFGVGSWGLNVIDPPPGLPLYAPDATYSQLGGTFKVRRVKEGEESQSPNSASVPESSNIFGILITVGLGYFAKRKLI